MLVCICIIMRKVFLKPGISIVDYTDKVGEEATNSF